MSLQLSFTLPNSEVFNVTDPRHSPDLVTALIHGISYALETRRDVLGTQHLLMGLIREEGIKKCLPAILNKSEVTGRELALLLEADIGKESRYGEHPVDPLRVHPGYTVREAFKYAEEETKILGSECITPITLIGGLLREREGLGGRVLRANGAELNNLRKIYSLII